MSFRENLKNAIDEEHKMLEGQEPFSTLIQKNLKDTDIAFNLQCFYSVFQDYFDERSDKSPFIHEVMEFFNKHQLLKKDSAIVKTNKCPESYLAAGYVFLGSRMGNSYILKSNPKIRESKYAEYFEIPFPSHEWNELIMEINKTPEEQQAWFIQEVKNYFLLLSESAKVH